MITGDSCLGQLLPPCGNDDVLSILPSAFISWQNGKKSFHHPICLLMYLFTRQTHSYLFHSLADLIHSQDLLGYWDNQIQWELIQLTPESAWQDLAFLNCWMECHLLTIKFTYLKYTIWWFLVYLQIVQPPPQTILKFLICYHFLLQPGIFHFSRNLGYF